MEPTVFADVDPAMTIAEEEVFGPVLFDIPISDYDDAIEVVNDVEFGLSACVVTHDQVETSRFGRGGNVEAGVVKINEKITGLELHVPFDGQKNFLSNTYREQGGCAGVLHDREVDLR